jgi:K+-sensing histidine kinase KdpD
MIAGASALAGLLNVVSRHLPRYGMAPERGRAVRPLVLIHTATALAITVIFNANVDAQGGASATGVLVIMTSAAFAVMLSALWNDNSLRATLAFGLVTLVFLYTLVANIFEHPDGIKIAFFFIAAIVVVSLASRVRRSLEPRQERIELDEKAKRFMEESSKGDEIHIVAHRRRFRDDPEEYARKQHEQRVQPHPEGRACPVSGDRCGGPLGVRGGSA